MTICFVCCTHPYKALTGGAHPPSEGGRGGTCTCCSCIQQPVGAFLPYISMRYIYMYISRSSLIPFWVDCIVLPRKLYMCMLCIYFWGNFGRGRFLSFTLIFKIYARASSKSQSKQNKCRATEIISLDSRRSRVPRPKPQAQAQAQPETEGGPCPVSKIGPCLKCG